MSNGDCEKRLDCLVCSNELSVTSSFSIYYTVIPQSGHLLADVIQKVIRIHVEQSALPSTFVCKKCFVKFQEFDRAEEKCNSLKKDILKVFNNNINNHTFNFETSHGVACQTENISDIFTTDDQSVDVKLEFHESCESNEEDENLGKLEGSNENQETKNTRNKCKNQSGKKSSESPISSKESVTNKSPEKTQPASEEEKNENNTDNSTKFEIRTKDARRRRRYVHPCVLCGRLFRRPCEVKQHLLSHGGAKPYKCQICLRRFGSKSGAGIHALKKHGKDVTVENIIDVCNDIVPDNTDGGYPSENLKQLLEQNMRDEGGKEHSDGSDSSNGDDDFEWKLDNEEELFGGGNDDDDTDTKLNLSGLDTNSQAGVSEPEVDTADLKDEQDVKNGDNEKTLSERSEEINQKHLKEDEKRIEKKSKASASTKPTSANTAIGNGTEDSRKKRKRKKRDPLPKVPKHECPICGKMWRTMSEFKSHVNTHSDERPFICEICGQAYKHKTALDIHVGMHNGINPFCCPFCNKAFTQKGALQRHMPIHTGEAPFQCELCGKRFVHHTSFNMHTLAHTGQKSYKCQVCGLALLSGSHLKRHSRVHTGERPYQCQTCGKRFAERYNLVAHTRVHDPTTHGTSRDSSKKLHKCQLCGAGFDRRPKLEDHLALSHNKISDADNSRKWVGHLISADVGGGAPGLPLGHGSGPSVVPHPGQHVGPPTVNHPPPPLVPGATHAPTLPPPPPPPPPDHHHHHHHHHQQQHHHPQQHQQQQQQQVWHHVLFGKAPADPHADDQHRLLTEMSTLGSGLGAQNRGVLAPCITGHPPLGGHTHNMTNPHPLGPATRLNMFGADSSN